MWKAKYFESNIKFEKQLFQSDALIYRRWMHEGPERVWDLLKIFSSNIQAQARIRDSVLCQSTSRSKFGGEAAMHIVPENTTIICWYALHNELQYFARVLVISPKRPRWEKTLIKMERWGQTTTVFLPQTLSRNFFHMKSNWIKHSILLRKNTVHQSGGKNGFSHQQYQGLWFQWDPEFFPFFSYFPVFTMSVCYFQF